MKTPPGRLRSRCQNEAVFRSAQRLLSVRALPRANANIRKPSFPRPRASAYLLVALALFIGGIFVGLHWRATTPGEIAEDARLLAGSAQSSSEEKPANAAALSSFAPAHERAAKSAAPTARKKPRARSGGDAAAATSAETPAHAPVQASANATTSPRSAGAAATPTVIQTTIVAGPEFTLRGRISSNSAPSLDLEFSLRRKDSALTGVVRYLLPDGKRVVANTVKGEIAEGRHVELHETGTAWTASNTAPRLLREFRPRRNFAFTLPEQTESKDMFLGWWSSYIQHDASFGELTLWFSAPW